MTRGAGARALVRRAFTGLGAQQVVATTMAVHAGSRRVMEKAGLRYVRTVHMDWPEPLDGNEHSDVEYRLLREEWLASTGPDCLSSALRRPAGRGSAGRRRIRGQPRAAATTARASSWIAASCSGPRNDSA